MQRTTMQRTYALVTDVHIETGRTSITHQEITSGAGQWSQIIRDASDRVTPKYAFKDPEWAVSIQVQTIGEGGSIKFRELSKCDRCDLHKIPGTRHKCDPRRSPKSGTVLVQDYSFKHWTGEPGGWTDASIDDPRYAKIDRGVQITVLEVVENEAQPAWEFEGRTFDAVAAYQSVRYFVTLTGQWDSEDDCEWTPGEHEDDLACFRRYVKDCEVQKA